MDGNCSMTISKKRLAEIAAIADENWSNAVQPHLSDSHVPILGRI
jgi:hypothetical protein